MQRKAEMVHHLKRRDDEPLTDSKGLVTAPCENARYPKLCGQVGESNVRVEDEPWINPIVTARCVGMNICKMICKGVCQQGVINEI